MDNTIACFILACPIVLTILLYPRKRPLVKVEEKPMFMHGKLETYGER